MGAPLRRVQGPVKHLSWGVECEPTSYELQANELLVVSQAAASCEPTSCQLQLWAKELQVYHIMICKFRTNKLPSCKPTNKQVTSMQVNDLRGWVKQTSFKQSF